MRVVQLKSATIQELVFRNDFQRLKSILQTKNNNSNQLQRKDTYPKIVEIKGEIPKNSDVKNPLFDLPLSVVEKEYNI